MPGSYPWAMMSIADRCTETVILFSIVSIGCVMMRVGLTGWVANNWDGSVTLEAQGERAALDELVPMIERSNRWARIEGMTTETLPPEEHEYSFSTRG